MKNILDKILAFKPKKNEVLKHPVVSRKVKNNEKQLTTRQKLDAIRKLLKVNDTIRKDK